MRLSIILFLLINSIMISFSQFESGYEYFEEDLLISNNDFKTEHLSSDSKFQWNGSLGASYIFSKNFSSVNTLQAGYGFIRALNPKFSVSGGVLVSAYFPVTGFFNQTETDFQNFSYVSIYGTGSYQLNERLVLYGTGIKHLVEFGADNPFSSYNFNEISIGTSLKLGNNVCIGASVHFVDRPGYYSPILDNGSGFPGFPASW